MAAGALRKWMATRREAHRQRLARSPDIAGNAHRIRAGHDKDPGDINTNSNPGGSVGGI